MFIGLLQSLGDVMVKMVVSQMTKMPITYLKMDLFHYVPPYSKKGGHSETLLNTCIAHSNSAYLLVSNNASDWLSGDFDNKNQ